MIRVVIADDHWSVRTGVAQFLGSRPGIEVVGEAADGDQAIAVCLETPADVLLLDVRMSGTSFAQVIRLLSEQRPELRIIVLSAHAESEYGVAAISAGAAGYLTKDHLPTDLVRAIERVTEGHKYVTPELGEILVERFAGDAPSKATALSARQMEVLELLASGKSNKEIAAILRTSPKTISSHKRRILEKLGLSSTADLVRYALERGYSRK